MSRISSKKRRAVLAAVVTAVMVLGACGAESTGPQTLNEPASTEQAAASAADQAASAEQAADQAVTEEGQAVSEEDQAVTAEGQPAAEEGQEVSAEGKAAAAGETAAAGEGQAEAVPDEAPASEETAEPAETAAAVDNGNTLVIAVQQDIQTLDPAKASEQGTTQVVCQICETLLTLDEDGTPSPMLASSWETEDNRIYVYQIRDDVRFSDGEPMTMEDVIFSLERNMDAGLRSEYRQYYENVQRIDQSDEWELTITLKKADESWQYVPATCAGAVIEKAFCEEEETFGERGTGIVGTGSYMIQTWDDAELRLIYDEDYWRTGGPDPEESGETEESEEPGESAEDEAPEESEETVEPEEGEVSEESEESVGSKDEEAGEAEDEETVESEDAGSEDTEDAETVESEDDGSEDTEGEETGESEEVVWEAPGIREICFRFFKSETELIAELKSGKTDICLNPTEEVLKAAEESDGLRVQTIPSMNCLYLAINCKSEYFSDPNVRLALAYAIDKDRLYDGILSRSGQEPVHMMTFGAGQYGKQTEFWTEFAGEAFDPKGDPAKAGEYLEESKYPEGFSCTLYYKGTPVRSICAEQIAQELGKISIEVDCQEVGGPDMNNYQYGISRDYDLLLISWEARIPDPAASVYPILHSSGVGEGGANASCYKNSEADELLDRQRMTPDPEERAEILAEALGIMAEDVPLIPLCIADSHAVMSERIEYELTPSYRWNFYVSDVKIKN